MWIFCCGMLRSGSTLHYQLTKELVELKNLGYGLGWAEGEKFYDLYEKHRHNNTIKVIKIHRYIPKAKELTVAGEAKIIHVYRDVRDIVVSILNKDKKSFWDIIRANLLQSLVIESKSWCNLESALVSKYEDMVDDLPKETKKIAEYLEINLEEGLADRIALNFSIEQQKKRIKQFNFNLQGERTGINVHDPNSLLHQNHIFSGKKGQWQTSLSAIKIGLIEDFTYKWLDSRNYKISQTLLMRKIAKISYFFYKSILKAKRILKAISKSLFSKDSR